MLLASGAIAQTSGTQLGTPPGNVPSTQAAPQSGTTQATPQPSTAQPAPAYRPPQAKTNEEFAGYKTAAALTDPNQVLAAADQFAQKYPDSELRELLYVQAMNGFAQRNSDEKLVEAGRKAIAIDPRNPIVLVPVASALVTVTHDNDLDKEERYAEAAKYAQAAIDNVNTGMHIPPNIPEAQVQAAKTNILTQAYDTLGVIDMQRQNFAGAEANFQKAADASKGDPAARVYLRLSVVQDKEKKYAEALVNANKALQYSEQGSIEQTLARQEQTRLQKLVEAGAEPDTGAPGAAPPSAAPATNPQTPGTPQQQPAQPH
jgi:hypothetical protein